MRSDGLREGIDRLIDQVAMTEFSRGFDACIEAIDELSNSEWNKGRAATAEVLRWAAKELNGENIEA